jgi:hypothetical protein
LNALLIVFNEIATPALTGIPEHLLSKMPVSECVLVLVLKQ